MPVSYIGRPTPLQGSAALPFDLVERMHRNGIICDRGWRLFNLLWTWGAPRYGGHAGAAQARFHRRCGPAALQRRHARAMGHYRRMLAAGITGQPRAALPH